LEQLHGDVTRVLADAQEVQAGLADIGAVVSSSATQWGQAAALPLARSDYNFRLLNNPSSPPSGCGYNVSFNPIPLLGQQGVSAQPLFTFGAVDWQLTELAPEFSPVCNGSFDVAADITISGIFGLSTVSTMVDATVPFAYSVDSGVGGIENLLILGDVSKVVDFAGLVGERQGFLLQGSIASPFTIINAIPNPDSFHPPLVRDLTPEEKLFAEQVVQPTQVPEPDTLLLLTSGLLGAGFAFRRRSEAACRTLAGKHGRFHVA
jgi:hypothetical protein